MAVGGARTVMVYDWGGHDVVHETHDANGDGDLNDSGDYRRTYWVLPEIDRRIGFVDELPGGATATYWYVCDANGSVHAVVDADGTVANRYAYDSFGMIDWDWSYETVPNRYAFQGREYDAERGDYHFRNRVYMPEWGLFSGPDMNLAAGPYGEAHGMMSYVFCGNDPWTYADPMGMDWVLSVEDGQAFVYEAGSIFSPRTRGVTAVGSYVEGPEYQYWDKNGDMRKTRDRNVGFEYNGNAYTVGMDVFRSALQNIPRDLSEKMLAADVAERKSLLLDFLLAPPEAGGVGAKIAAIGDVVFMGIAAGTSFGMVDYDVSQGGGLFQEISGCDSRGASYQSIAQSSSFVNEASVVAMEFAAAYVGTEKGFSLGGDVSVRPGKTVTETPSVTSNTGVSKNAGRSGKQVRLKQLADDPNVSSTDRGWIKQDLNQIERGKRTRVRVPPGNNLAHRRGFEAKKGFSYENSDLQTIELHKLQHKHEGY